LITQDFVILRRVKPWKALPLTSTVCHNPVMNAPETSRDPQHTPGCAPPKPGRRWLQFSFKIIILLTVVSAVAVTWWNQRNMIDEVATERDSDILAGRESESENTLPPLGSWEDYVPPWERWELRFESVNLTVYAQQIDHFKIELGAVGGEPFNTVNYARNLSKSENSLTQTWFLGFSLTWGTSDVAKSCNRRLRRGRI